MSWFDLHSASSKSLGAQRTTHVLVNDQSACEAHDSNHPNRLRLITRPIERHERLPNTMRRTVTLLMCCSSADPDQGYANTDGQIQTVFSYLPHTSAQVSVAYSSTGRTAAL